jgi:hypothetical protein
VSVRAIRLVTNPVVEHCVVPGAIFGSEDHMVALGSAQGGRAIPVDPGHCRVNTAAGARGTHSKIDSGQSGLDVGIICSGPVSLKSPAIDAVSVGSSSDSRPVTLGSAVFRVIVVKSIVNEKGGTGHRASQKWGSCKEK